MMKKCAETFNELATKPVEELQQESFPMRIRIWAFANAYWLIFLTFMFGVSWLVEIWAGSSFK